MRSPPALWLKKTNVGKVVYESKRNLEDRPRHFFSIRDVFRIARTIGKVGIVFVAPAVWWGSWFKVADMFKMRSPPAEDITIEIESLIEDTGDVEDELKYGKTYTTLNYDILIIMKERS